jgi:hypothetical protein
MKSIKSSPVFWFMFMLSAVALIGFSFTPVMADDGQGILEADQEEGVPMAIDDGGADADFGATGDGSFGPNYQATWLPSADFTPYDSSTYYVYSTPGMRYITSGSPYMDAGVRLPSGARLILVRIYYYDGNASSRIHFVVFKNRMDVSPFTYTTPVSVYSPTGSVGYGNSYVNVDQTIQNAQYWYHARWIQEAYGSSLRFSGARFFWYRQVRTGLPNPFNDIGYLNSRFQNAIKALAASGITGGCGGGSYCPSAPVTRGQMAVFLAEGLGLYWDFYAGY